VDRNFDRDHSRGGDRGADLDQPSDAAGGDVMSGEELRRGLEITSSTRVYTSYTFHFVAE
jgi:hypothetical protein